MFEGSHSNLMVSGQYLYFLNEDSVICRYDFVNKTEKVLSKYTYSEFVVYFGAIYGIRKADNFIYQVSTSGRSDSTTATATPSATPSVTYEGEDDAYEFRLVKEACSGFAVEDNWLYAIIGVCSYRYQKHHKNGKIKVSQMRDFFFFTMRIKLFCDGNFFHVTW